MPLGLLGVLDLSIITDTLLKLLDDCKNASPLWQADPFTITMTGAMPEAVRNDGNCQLSLYLFHIEQDKFQRNTPVTRSSVIPQQPMSLDLYYLLTAYAEKRYIEEQQAMSIAMRCF